MGRRFDKESDNLWLLLDTICNAFGGMVIIALVYALHANEVRIEKPTRELELAVENAKQSLLDVKGQQTKMTNTMAALRPRIQLWEKVQRLSNDCANLAMTVSNLTSSVNSNNWFLSHPQMATTDTVARLNTLTGELSEKTNSLGQLMRANVELTNALFQAQTSTLTNEVRFPKERDARKTPLHVILRYNSVFLTRDPTGKQGESANTTSLRWTMGDANTILVTTIPGRGLAPGDPSLLTKVNRLDTNRTYLVCWVYADSFSAFNRFKEPIEKANLEYGWKPVELDEAISISTEPVPAPRPQ